MATLELLGGAVLVCGLDGTEHHRTPALGTLLSAEPERERLLAMMRATARQLAFGAGPAPDAADRTLQTPTARYRLRAALLSPELLPPGGAALLALVREGTPLRLLPGPDVLRRRYPLSRREAEVALLLAEGLANDAIARRLFISPHTARRHTEHVLGKLGLSSRKALALKLLQETASVTA